MRAGTPPGADVGPLLLLALVPAVVSFGPRMTGGRGDRLISSDVTVVWSRQRQVMAHEETVHVLFAD